MTQGIKIVWKGQEALKKMEDSLSNRLKIIGALMERDIKRSLGNPPPASRPGEPPHRAEGALWRNIAHEVEGNTLRVGTNIKYAKWLELGTQPYTIRPKNKKMLAWKDRETGEWIRAKEVHHPGIAARPFLRPALDNAKDDIEKMLRLD